MEDIASPRPSKCFVIAKSYDEVLEVYMNAPRSPSVNILLLEQVFNLKRDQLLLPT